MALKIINKCTACGLCLPECPIDAITEGDIYDIDSNTCNECNDQKDGPLCVVACPVDCITRK